MNRRFALILLLALPLGAAAQQASGTVPGPAPQELIEESAQAMLEALDADREAYQKDAAKVRALVDRVLLPHFDTDYSAMLVLGKHWRTASPEQRKRFVEAFYQSLLSKYGAALASFTGENLTMLPFRGDLASGRATVRTEVTTSDGTRVPVNYSMRATQDGWKAWDVTIEGISYVKNFRTDFGAEIDQRGLDAVIERLESESGAAGEAGDAAAG
jgi:phospholipid transport system substrate-binding protein